jgi:hypothetical protein
MRSQVLYRALPDFLHVAWVNMFVPPGMFLCSRICSRQVLGHCFSLPVHVQEALDEQMVVVNAIACSSKLGRLMW